MKDSIKIQLKLDDRIHELTIEQAKELYDTLGYLLGIRSPVFVPQPYPVPFYPLPRPYWEITYVGDNVFTASSMSKQLISD